MTSPADARAAVRYRAALAVAVVLLLLLVWIARSVVLLAFAGLLLSIALRTPADWLAERTPLTPRWALVAVVGGVLLVLVGGFWLRGPAVAAEIDALRDRLPEAIERLKQRVAASEFGARVIEQAPEAEELLPDAPVAVERATGVLSGILKGVAHAAVVLFLGVVFAAQPQLYTDGLVRLVPPRRRERAREVLGELGTTLKRWLLAQLISMTIVGVLTGIGLWVLGIPLAFTLALIAGLLEFVPYVGPLLAGVPAVLLGFLQGPQQALYVLLLFLAIQAVESYVVQPVVQWKAVFIPPALIILGQLVFAILGGGWGVALAAPLVAVVLVLVRTVYVEDVLKDRDTAPA